MKHLLVRLYLTAFCCAATLAAEPDWVVYEPPANSANGKHIVLISGDEEYRSEEALPMLGKILSQRHGFKCTVLFSVNPDGTINPDKQDSISNSAAIANADLIVMALRFRNWPEADMKHFIDACRRGIPIVALRTSTHAFQYPASNPLREFNTFGERVLGEEWVSHWGRHKVEATKGIIEQSAKNDPILRGVSDIFGDTDVYEAYPPADAKILVRGQVLKGMKPQDPPASYRKRRASDKQQQDVNEPMMPVAWTRLYKNEAGNTNRIFCTTLGSATDLVNEGLRRLVVNAVFWGLGMEIPQRADVRFIGDFNPTMYGFGAYKKGVRPADFNLRKSPAATEKRSFLKLQPGDHVAILGNALPDRMQHSGFFETLVHAYLPEHKLVFRNLSAAGDEVNTWFRSENFGERDEWLKKVQADVILAFYGFVESTKTEAGLEKFMAELDSFLKQTRANNYSGRGNPRIVLFSPIADEKHQDPNFPDPGANNQNIAIYTAAMAQVAAANDVHFVNLYEPSLKLYEAAAREKRSLTVNGHYLTPEGDRQLAGPMFEAVFGAKPPTGSFEELRAAVNEKNRQWHQRYRTIDGYNVYGGRSALAYQEGKPGFISDRNPPEGYISNYRVMQEEMSQRDVLTANRDLLVWARAQGRDHTVDDSNLPPVTEVPSNQPGPKADKSHLFLSGEEAIAKMKLHSGMQINLFADEKQFPDLIKPVQMTWDTRGRLWVAVWPNYPERTPTSTKGDSLVIFEDTNADGKADKMTTFADDLNAPTGFQFYKDGVLLMQAPDLWFLRDIDGDGRADYRERVLMGMDSADSHHTANAICLDPGGAIYLSDGVFHRTQVETSAGVTRNRDAAIYRFEPRTGRFETYISYGFANPHGRVFDYWGNDLVTDATGNNTYFGPAFSGYLDYEKGKHPGMRQFWDRPSRPCPATGILTSRHFPEEFQGNFLNLNVISFLGVFRVKVSDEGSGLKGETLEHLISSEDPNFRPIAISTGPDGAIYLADWHNPIIGHMQHHLRDPSRDKQHGRIYRITYGGRPLMTPPQIHGAPIPALLDLLKEPENQTRELAKVELGARDPAQVIAATREWTSRLDKSAPDYEHHMMEALWVHQWMNIVDLALLNRMLRSPEPRARAAAGRVLCYWRDRVPDSLTAFRQLAEDEHPRVRLEAVRAASFYRTHRAAEVALLSLKRPMDYYLDYCLNETLRQLEPYWRQAIAAGEPLAADNPAGVERLISRVSSSELEKLPRTDGVLTALITRPGIPEASRMLALDDLAARRASTKTAELLALIAQLKSGETGRAETLARLLTLMAPGELKAARSKIASLTGRTEFVLLARAAWASLAVADGSFDRVWATASKDASALLDLVSGIPLILDPGLRDSAADKVRPLFASHPASSTTSERPPVFGRFVRIELPRSGTLTLAEVEVLSAGKNIAPAGRARQSSTAYGGNARNAIDGRMDGSYSSGTQTHTREDERNPWWELDLGGEKPIDEIVVWNRADDGEGIARRLDGFTLTILDAKKREVFSRTGISAPPKKAAIAVRGVDPAAALPRAAITAYVSMPEQQPAAFGTLAKLIARGQHVHAAATGLRALPRNHWNAAGALDAAPALAAWAKKVPDERRTDREFVEVMQVAEELAGLLPAQRASALRRHLRELRVAVFVVRTVREQMRFDTTRLVVEAGKPFQVTIENIDFMPHNFVIVRPGAREKIGPIVERMKPDQLDSRGRAFVPRTDDIIAATKLLEGGEVETLQRNAPEEEGIYEFVCTFPGHWQVMWGQFVVTRNVEDYLAKNPRPIQPAATTAHQHHFE